MIQTDAKLTQKKQLTKNTFLISLETKKIASLAKPGQFVNILIENHTLRRPFSICEIESTEIKIAFKVRGAGTKKMASWQIGQTINILGPLGKGFSPPHKTDNILIIGGGIGCFALLELAKQSLICQTILGFKNASDVVLANEFKRYGRLYLYTQDGSVGKHGLVTDSLENLIKQKNFNRIVSCGPLNMMKAAYEIAKNFKKIDFEVCLEERMACGIGACLGCQCKIIKNGRLQSKHICCDGPVFKAKEVFF